MSSSASGEHAIALRSIVPGLSDSVLEDEDEGNEKRKRAATISDPKKDENRNKRNKPILDLKDELRAMREDMRERSIRVRTDTEIALMEALKLWNQDYDAQPYEVGRKIKSEWAHSTAEAQIFVHSSKEYRDKYVEEVKRSIFGDFGVDS